MKDNLCSKIIPVVFMFCICFIAFQIESVKAWQASFEGCSRIKCDNAGIEKVIVRVSRMEYKIIEVSDWVENDEYLNGQLEY